MPAIGGGSRSFGQTPTSTSNTGAPRVIPSPSKTAAATSPAGAFSPSDYFILKGLKSQGDQFNQLMGFFAQQQKPQLAPIQHLSGAEKLGFQTQRDAARNQFASFLIGNEASRGQFLQDWNEGYRRNQRDMDYQMGMMPGAANMQGLLNSGEFLRQMDRAATSRTEQLADMLRQKDRQLAQYRFGEDQARGTLSNALAQISLQEQLRRQQLAASLGG